MTAITDDEAALYDRQIRLWGVEAQTRLRSSRILLYGMFALHAEVAKNIILAGVNAVTFAGDKVVTEEDLGANFLLCETSSIGQNYAMGCVERAQLLNPNVNVTSLALSANGLEMCDDEFIKSYDVISVSGMCLGQAARLNERCRNVGVKFFASNILGMLGMFFADLGDNFEYFEEKKVKKDVKDTGEEELVTVKGVQQFVPLKVALNFRWKDAVAARRVPQMFFAVRVVDTCISNKILLCDSSALREMRDKLLPDFCGGDENARSLCPDELLDIVSSQWGYEFSPISAIIGGTLAQEILKATSRKECPHSNFFLFDGNEGIGYVERLL